MADNPGPPAACDPPRAFFAFQLLEHWGNRETPRLSPRAEVLAAALLAGVPWNGQVEGCGGYAAALVGWLRGEAVAGGREGVAGDGLGAPGAAADAVNRAALSAAFALASALVAGSRERASLGAIVGRDGPVRPALRWVDDVTLRVRPWPFVGRRLTVRGEIAGVPVRFTILRTSEPV